MEPIEKFFSWYITLGGNIFNEYNESLLIKFKEVSIKNSSLKERARKIKDQYNYKFKT